MFRKIFIPLSVLILTAMLLAACGGPGTGGSATNTPANANMANPASVFCEENGGKLEIRTDDSGAQAGFCVFTDGSECDEWAYFRGECKPGDSLAPVPNMANPASVYCEQQGGALEIRTDDAGGQAGYCIFPDATSCEEWAYMRGECKPGDSLTGGTPGMNMANPASVNCEAHGGQLDIRTDDSGGQVGYCIFPDASECEEWAYSRGECSEGQNFNLNADGWKLYHNVKLGYTFAFPADALMIGNEEPMKSVNIDGPKVGDTMAYAFTIAHPADREDFSPPVDANLTQWLTDHYLTGETRAADVTIAGETAIHYRHDRSPQSYADDRYFFAHDGQLYQIVVGHTNDSEDWDLYNAFLQSWSFDAR